MNVGQRQLAVFHANAGVQVGWGHIVRCSALATALLEQNWQVVFLATEGTVAVLDVHLPNTVTHHLLDHPISAPQTIAALKRDFRAGCDLMVLDDYDLDKKDEAAFRPWARCILAMEDIPGRQHDCDLLLDPTPGRSRANYTATLPEAAAALMGSRFALLRDPFGSIDRVPDVPPRILISFGATDPNNVTEKTLEQLDGFAVDILLSGTAPALGRVRQLVKLRQYTTNLHVDISAAELSILMSRCVIAIGAGGSSAWERCAAGLPSVVVKIADNQSDVIEAVLKNGAAVEGHDIRSEVDNLLKDTDRRERISKAARRLCDGFGARRIAHMLSGIQTRHGGRVTLRPAHLDDSSRMLEWQRQPATRRFAHKPAPPTRSEHDRWFTQRMSDSDSQLYIAELYAVPAGVLRLDCDGDETWRVSIYVSPESHGKGVGRAMLELAHIIWPTHEFTAEVLAENAVSHKLFAAAGYEMSDDLYRRSASNTDNNSFASR